MPHKYNTVDKKSEAMAALRRSADEHDGDPNWYAVSKATGHARQTLRKWWAEGQAAPRPAGEVRVFPGSEAPPEFDPVAASEVTYWMFCWGQLASELKQATSDVARVNLMKRQDDVFFKLRDALEVERKRRPATKEELLARLTSEARMLAPEMAQAVLVEFKRRGIA